MAFKDIWTKGKALIGEIAETTSEAARPGLNTVREPAGKLLVEAQEKDSAATEATKGVIANAAEATAEALRKNKS